MIVATNLASNRAGKSKDFIHWSFWGLPELQSRMSSRLAIWVWLPNMFVIPSASFKLNQRNVSKHAYPILPALPEELAEVKGRLVRLNRNLDEARWQNYETQNESHVQVELWAPKTLLSSVRLGHVSTVSICSSCSKTFQFCFTLLLHAIARRIWGPRRNYWHIRKGELYTKETCPVTGGAVYFRY